MTDYKELVEAARALVADVLDYQRVNNLSPNPGKAYCWQSVERVQEALSLAAQPVEQPVAWRPIAALLLSRVNAPESVINDTAQEIVAMLAPVSADTIRQQALEEAADLMQKRAKANKGLVSAVVFLEAEAAIRSLASSPASASATPDTRDAESARLRAELQDALIGISTTASDLAKLQKKTVAALRIDKGEPK